MSTINAEILSAFVEDTRRDVNVLFTLLAHYKSGDTSGHSEIVMKLHSIKGNSRFVYNKVIEQAAHASEALFENTPDDDAFESINMQLEIIQNALDGYDVKDTSNTEASAPIAKSWERLPEIITALEKDLNKTVTLETSGGFDAPTHIVEGLRNPLMHLITNAATHGIKQNGSVAIDATLDDSALQILVKDDGQGLDKQIIQDTANACGINTDKMDDAHIYQLIFNEGFSTREDADHVAGRGIGLFAVQQDLAKINASIVAESQPNQGTRFTIRILVSDF